MLTFRIVQTATLQAGKGSEAVDKEEEDEDLLSDEESVRIYPIKANKRKPETKDLEEEQESNFEEKIQPPKSKRSKPEFCFKTRDY